MPSYDKEIRLQILKYIRDKNDVGWVSMPYSMMAKDLYTSTGMLSRACREFKNKGFIEKVHKGGQKRITDSGRKYLEEFNV